MLRKGITGHYSSSNYLEELISNYSRILLKIVIVVINKSYYYYIIITIIIIIVIIVIVVAVVVVMVINYMYYVDLSPYNACFDWLVLRALFFYYPWAYYRPAKPMRKAI